MYEWTDPNTEEEHRCPKNFMRVIDFLHFGHKRAVYADVLLGLLGIVPKDKRDREKNLRHLRQATMIYRRQNVLIISIRSGHRGGYFLATPDDVEQAEAMCSLEEKLARSMLSNTAWFRLKYAEMCEMNRQQVLPRAEPPQRRLF
jgi:hypothetical protein